MAQAAKKTGKYRLLSHHLLFSTDFADYSDTEIEVKADAEQVVHDAETAAAPLVAEAEQDVKQVAGDAAGGFIPGPRTSE